MYDEILLNSKFGNNETNKKNSNIQDLDTIFDNLTNDVENFNKFISNVNKQNKVNGEEFLELSQEREKIEKARVEFDNYMRIQKEEFRNKQEQFDEQIKIKKNNLSKAEEEFKMNMDNSLKELELSLQEMKMKKDKFDEEKAQFEEYKNIEISRIKHAEEVLKSEKNQFEKYKEVNIKRIELENKNLEQKCDRFKNLISQFNSNFKPMIENEE
ncbi:MAG: hypothetical protein IJY25_06075 [Bacilli bacterium]|nr:hypothetical protein [Bacilli bacterium]